MRKLANEELNRKTISEFKNSSKTPVVIVLDNVRSLNNIGSVFRTADAFLVEALYLCGISGCPPNKDIHKTALGATDTVSWKYFKTTTECINYLSKNNYEVWAVEQAEKSIPLNKFTISTTKKYAIIFGNEIKGVEQEAINLCKGCIEIPQQGTKHSLNIAVSAGIVMWELFNKVHTKKNS